ncbi:hypothetical protein BDV96DRAFT_574207 [Lophiotrema nucula]|uniref:Uncharacterized protein n=1 Tax=Lophiotrema nucula TaxID=690887 RepID=A0A6A5Z872_9PLEO|nr:hypothetical protein BDV96DRAFT_574207 [Lophiotrema nucula]
MPLNVHRASEVSATSSSTVAEVYEQSKHAKETTSATTASEESDFRQHRLSPMFTTKISTAQAMHSSDRYRSTKVHDAISPIDGKTKSCDRSHTFDTFVPHRHLGDDKPEKRMGHTWDVVRAVAKLRKPAKNMARRASVRRSEKSHGFKRMGETDHERLMSVG